MPAQHELARALADSGLAPSPVLVEMLDEHHSHRSERRGCGYTQATRFLSDLINGGSVTGRERYALFAAEVDLSRLADPAWREPKFRAIEAQLRFSESKLLLQIIEDLAAPDRDRGSVFPVSGEKLKVGSCPLAEQYFLEIAHGRVRRGGRIHVWRDASNRPLLIEKRGLGDERSAISVDVTSINGVRLPAGSLYALDYEDSELDALPLGGPPPHRCVETSRIRGGRFLRLTTLAVDPADRARAFSAHFQQQIDNGLFSPDTTCIAQLTALAVTLSG